MLHMKCISKCVIPKLVAFDSEWAAYQLRRDVVSGISHTLLIYFSFLRHLKVLQVNSLLIMVVQ